MSSESNALSKRQRIEGPPHMASASADSFFAYILQCADGTLYIGRTSDLTERIIRHNEGRGAAWTSRRRPVKLVYNEPFPSELEATRRELQLKRWSLAKKLALINGASATLKSLAKRRTRN